MPNSSDFGFSIAGQLPATAAPVPAYVEPLGYRVLIETAPGKQVPAFRTRFTYADAKAAADRLNPALAPVIHSARVPAATTAAQRAELKARFATAAPVLHHPLAAVSPNMRWRTYRAWRAGVVPEIGGRAVMVQWCGFWLGIEPDGHAHS